MKTTDNKLEYKIIQPEPDISDFVERFYIIKNNSFADKEIILVPDGRLDLFFIITESNQFNGTLIGLETQPTKAFFPPKCTFIGVSLKLLSIEYILQISIADIVNNAKDLPDGFWGITLNDLLDFEIFCNKMTKELIKNIHPPIDERKQKLFNLIYETHGSLMVKEYAQKIFWSERQINRYFHQTFGLPLKTFCNILRFKASFQNIKEGILFPEQNFSDQAHFIREVKRLTKVTPKKLSQNENDRFIQFSTIQKK